MSDINNDETIPFTSGRLNRKPAVVRGMTMVELMLVIAISAGCGAVFGIFLTICGIGWYIIFVMTLGFAIVGVKFGGSYISSVKRGKPETYFERLVDYRMNKSRYVTVDQKWAIRRSKFHKK